MERIFKMRTIGLEKQADEQEAAFINASSNLEVSDEEHAEMLGELFWR